MSGLVPPFAPSSAWVCTPAACTRPACARRSASPEPQGHQANATGGSSRDSGVASSGRAGSQPATRSVGRGGPIGRTAITSGPAPAVAPALALETALATALETGTANPPAGRKPSPAPVSPRSGRATSRSPTGASITRSPAACPTAGRSRAPRPAIPATLVAVTSAAGSPGPNSSSTDMPSACPSASATRSDGSECPDSTADTACLLTPAMPASCCCENPRACRASRSPAPAVPGPSVMNTDRRRPAAANPKPRPVPRRWPSRPAGHPGC